MDAFILCEMGYAERTRSRERCRNLFVHAVYVCDVYAYFLCIEFAATGQFSRFIHRQIASLHVNKNKVIRLQ
jgi:hypothetical protein